MLLRHYGDEALLVCLRTAAGKKNAAPKGGIVSIPEEIA